MNKYQQKAKPKGAGTNAELLIKNLRLLDLDEEFDWPNIGPDAFSSTGTIQGQKERVRSSEWILCKLLELWDPKETKESLQDLFPALEPRQSIALRAVLFKKLTNLRRTGVLSKEIVVRKTMLDDCKGPKFEELLAVLSTIVLHKLLAENVVDNSVAKQHIQGRLPQDKEKVFHLSLAYQASCSAKLYQRQVYERRWDKFGRVLKAKKDELEQRARRIEETKLKRKEKRIPQRTLERLRKHLDSNWAGDSEWIEILLRSDKHRRQNVLLERSFGDVWNHACNDTLYTIRPERNDSLLQNLQTRVDEQNSRLTKWRLIQERLIVQTEAMASNTVTKANSHQPSTPSTPRRFGESKEYSEHVFSETRNDDEGQRPASGHARNFSWHLGQRPQVNSPLVSESTRPSSSSQMNTASIGDGSLSFIHIQSDPKTSDSFRSPEAESMPQAVDPSQRMGPGFQRSQNAPGGSAELGEPHEYFAPSSEQDILAADIVSSVIDAAPSPLKRQPSLADRTRMSMAMMSPQRIALPPQSGINPRHQSPDRERSHQTSETNPAARTPDHRETLAERTRQSMSLMSARSKVQPRKSRVSRLSNVYPINQFDSRNRSELAHEAADSSMLEEELEAMHEDEEAVFKSRPKIALSPPPMLASDEEGDVEQV